ncbi:MAG: HAD-IIA family hydrolase [Nitrososphaerota archaeon]
MHDAKRLASILDSKSLFILDGDGTLYVGRKRTKGASAFLRLLASKGKKFLIMTNNSSFSSAQHAVRISTILGVTIKREDLLVSTQVAIKYLKDHSISSVYALAVPAVRREFASAGISLTSVHPEMVVIAFDTTLTYKRLAKATRMIMLGIPYIATHPDILCPTNGGYQPDVGSFLSLIQTATGKRPVAITGKPNRLMLEYGLQKMKVNPDDTVIFGDRPYTDIKMANKSGITSVLMLGESNDVSAQSTARPDFTLRSFSEIIEAW